MNIKEEILEHTNRGLEVFSFYMPIDFVPKRNFRNPLYEDKRASCNIYFDTRSKCYRMKDFGNEMYSGDCFWLAATILGLDMKRDFMRVLKMIINDLQLNISLPYNDRSEKSRSNANIPPKPPISVHVSKQTDSKKWFRIAEQPYKDNELVFWARYGIGTKTLLRFQVKSIARFESVSNQGKAYTIHSSSEEPMFCYVMRNFAKVYRPFSKMRFLYGGEKAEDYVFGFEQLPNKGDILFITGGEKDVLSLSAHHFNAICFNSETAQIPESIIESLLLRFRHIILLYDTDETGLREAERQAEILSAYKVLTLTLPLQGIKSEKDISDYFALGHNEIELRGLLSTMLSQIYTQTIMMLRSCEIDYDNPPNASKSVVTVNGVPLGTQDNLFCITGGEGTGIRSANDETESIAIVDEQYRLAGIYNTCIICVLHFVPNGIKLRGHIGSELQRKAAGILSIEKDDNPEYSVVKALKVRDGSPLDVPMMLFGWDKVEGMHVYRGEKSKEDKEKRKTDELIVVIKEAFRNTIKLTYQELCEVLMREMEIKDRTAKKYIAYMKEQRILVQDASGNYQKGELCHT